MTLSISILILKDEIIEAYAEWGEGGSELHMNLDRKPPHARAHTHTHARAHARTPHAHTSYKTLH